MISDHIWPKSCAVVVSICLCLFISFFFFLVFFLIKSWSITHWVMFIVWDFISSIIQPNWCIERYWYICTFLVIMSWETFSCKLVCGLGRKKNIFLKYVFYSLKVNNICGQFEIGQPPRSCHRDIIALLNLSRRKCCSVWSSSVAERVTPDFMKSLFSMGHWCFMLQEERAPRGTVQGNFI